MEIVKVNLENEMDLMLAYKKSMKLADLCGLSVLLQTSFATAVSEIARCVIKERKGKSFLNLKIDVLKSAKKYLVASVTSKVNFEKDYPEAIHYAKRLSGNVSVTNNGEFAEVTFVQSIGFGGLINDAKLDSFVQYFKTEMAISPYDEVRKKNIMLLEVAEKLRVSETRYRDLTRTLPLMIFSTNALGNLNYANKWLMDYFKLAEIQPDKLSWLNFLDNTEVKKIRAEWEHSMSTQTQYTVQAKLKGKDKDDFLWHIVSMTPVKNEEGQLLSWTGFFVDVHSQKLVEETLENNKELKETQKQLLKSQKNLEEKVFELKKSNHDLEQFAYIASHDLQEPLRKIRSFSGLVKRYISNPEEAEKYADKIEISSARMATLIRDVLNYSRLIKSDNSFMETDLNSIMSNVIQDMELVIEEKKAVINTMALPSIQAVPQQIQQLFYNLLGNALKFNYGLPVIDITCKKISDTDIKKMDALHSGSNYIQISFKDNGIGFEEEYTDEVFTIFKRLHPREAYSGTGIGLALCKKIVDNHHGVITVKSEVGKGTEFFIVLPVE